MLAGYPPADRGVIEQIVREPRFRDLTSIPVFAWQTLAVITAAYALLGAGTLTYLSGGPYVVALFLNSVGAFWAFTPLHDATHRSVSRSPLLNDVVGFLGAFPLLPGITARIYRYLHLEHHLHTGHATRDPDDPFVSWKGLRAPLVLAAPDVLWTVWYLRHRRSRPLSERLEFVAGISFYVGVHAAFLASPHARLFLLLWVIPQRVALTTITYFFARIQHPEGVEQRDNPFQGTVLIEGGRLMRFFMLSQSEHLMHHIFPSVPFYRYHDVWEAGRRLFEDQPIIRRGLFRARPFVVKGPATAVIEAVVVSAREVGEGVCAYEIADAGGAPLPAFAAGAHIDVHLGSGGVRPYSLCNPPGETHRYVIAVKRQDGGRGGSRWIHENLRAGRRISISPPRNHFPLDERAAEYVLIAGGIGVTPLLAMAHALHARGARFTLHVSARGLAAVPFGSEIARLPFADRVHVHAGEGDKLRPGEVLGRYVEGRIVYLCGPTGFMRWVIDAASANGWPRSAIVTEAFAPPAVDPRDNRPIDLRLARSGKAVVVRPDQSILEVLQEHRIGLPSNCTQGTCGACAARVLDGTPDHRDAVLSPEERRACDRMLVCVSRAKGGSLTLDL